MQKLFSKYRQHFPEISNLYGYQEEVLRMANGRQNTLGIIPTGGGKSLIFQLLAINGKGITLVICPLVALMNEQVEDLNARGIPALALNSSMSSMEQRTVLRELKHHNYKLIYVSAERLQVPLFKELLIRSGVDIHMIVVDEAHCISQWGDNFRPDYGQIPSFIRFLHDNDRQPFVLCLTATMSVLAREEIVSKFGIDPACVFINPQILRRNLSLEFRNVEKDPDKEEVVLNFLRKHKPHKTIAYLYSKHKCEEFANDFHGKHGFRTEYFHSDRKQKEKNEVYNRFKKGEIDILFATSAFGMGINIKDIDCVIHIQIPPSIEEYYQQVGRGWRQDSERICHCLALWTEKNFEIRRRELQKMRYTLDDVRECYRLLTGSTNVKKRGWVTNKSKETMLSYPDYNLPLLKYKFERLGIFTFLGELNGSPKSYTLKRRFSFWDQVLKIAEVYDAFSYVCNNSGITFREISDFIYRMDAMGLIKKQAMARDCYFEVPELEPSVESLEQIVKEIDGEVNYRIWQLDELKIMYQSKNATEQLEATLK